MASCGILIRPTALHILLMNLQAVLNPRAGVRLLRIASLHQGISAEDIDVDG